MNHINRFSRGLRKTGASANQTLSNILHAPHISGPTGCTLSKLETILQAALLTDTSSPRRILSAQNVSHVEPLLPSSLHSKTVPFMTAFFLIQSANPHFLLLVISGVLVWQPTEATYEIGVWLKTKKDMCCSTKEDENGGKFTGPLN